MTDLSQGGIVVDINLDYLYACWVGLPDPNKWEEDRKDVPLLGHGYYAFCEGLRLGVSLGRLIAEEEPSAD